ncbi:hypothetical protein C1646_749700 [Rhizophagus diaphanus]|nr:hypothetical protein C1646_749700 [Rhizophagus diaphanus] [Rhizophagus sp. MUCL 43196]
MLNIRVQNNNYNNNNKVNSENIDSFLLSQRIRFKKQQVDLDALYYLTLHIGTHNINGLAGDNAKHYGILNWMQENQVDIMALNETNLNQKNGVFKTPNNFKEQFTGQNVKNQAPISHQSGINQVANCDQKRLKHSSLESSQQDESNGSKIKCPILYLDCLCDTTKQNNPSDTLEQLKREMHDKAIYKKSNNIIHILMGDFSLITNSLIDRTSPQHISRPKFFNDLETLGLIDSYRKFDEEVLGNTYHKEDTSDLIRNNRKNTVYDKLPTDNTYSRVIYDCDNIETERWDNFWLNIKNQLNSLDQNLFEDRANFKEYSQEDIDRYWDKLNGIIVYPADTELPRKVIRYHKTFKCYNKKKSKPERHINKLLKLLHNYYYGNRQMITTKNAKFRWTSKIAKYNQDYVTSTEDNYKYNITTHDMFLEEWFDTFKKNILDRNTLTNIVIDKVLVNEETEILTKRLATKLREVKKAVNNDFVNMFRKRNTLLNTIIPIWRQIYEPIGKFKEVMESTIEKITMVEWNNTVKELNKESAVELSGINYRIILQLPEELILFMIKSRNLILQTGLVPMIIFGKPLQR